MLFFVRAWDAECIPVAVMCCTWRRNRVGQAGCRPYCNVSHSNAHCNQVEPSCCHQWVWS